MKVPALVTLSAAAIQLGASYATVRRRCFAGDLASIRFGSGANAQIRIERRALEPGVADVELPEPITLPRLCDWLEVPPGIVRSLVEGGKLRTRWDADAGQIIVPRAALARFLVESSTEDLP